MYAETFVQGGDLRKPELDVALPVVSKFLRRLSHRDEGKDHELG